MTDADEFLTRAAIEDFAVHHRSEFRKRQKAEKLNMVQLQRLVEIVEVDPKLHFDKDWKDKRELRKRWTKAGTELNDLGPAKSWFQWRQTWRDLRGKVRRKQMDIKKSKLPWWKLNDLEQRVFRIIRRDPSIKAILSSPGGEKDPQSPSSSECWDLPESKFGLFQDVPHILENGNEVLAAGFNNVGAALESVALSIEYSGNRLSDALNSIAEAIWGQSTTLSN